MIVAAAVLEMLLLGVTASTTPQASSPRLDLKTSTQRIAALTNSSGVLAGAYETRGRVVGFVRSAEGKLVVFSRPDWTFTSVESLNEKGAAAGAFSTEAEPRRLHGYIRSGDGAIATFDVPGSTSTVPEQIQDNGEITGYYLQRDGAKRLFRRTADGSIVTLGF